MLEQNFISRMAPKAITNFDSVVTYEIKSLSVSNETWSFSLFFNLMTLSVRKTTSLSFKHIDSTCIGYALSSTSN